MDKLVLIKTLKELQELKEYVNRQHYIAFDTETTGITKESKIVGFSIAAEEDLGYYVVLYQWDKDQNQLIGLETLEGAKDFLETLQLKDLIMHNSVFDCAAVYNNYKVALMPYVHTDTMIMGHILNENRSNALKSLGVALFGDDAKQEQTEVKESVARNGGKLTKDCYELYKADPDVLGKYGAKDAILTIKLFIAFFEELAKDLDLHAFFYNEESMDLLRGPTYEMNTTGLKLDIPKLQALKSTIEANCMQLKAQIYDQVVPLVQDKYPGKKKANTFNIHSSNQIAWLLFVRLGNEFGNLTKEGKNLCKSMGWKIPYGPKAKRDFIHMVTTSKDSIYEPAKPNLKTGKMGRPKKVKDVSAYLMADKNTLKNYANKYQWIKKLLEYSKEMKILNTYVEGILERAEYGLINPSFLQHGTTSGRYSSRNPNFQNLPRDDKRIKECIISRPNKVFVGADYSQLEPRVFASFSKDERLLSCFKNGDDFYSVIGATTFKHSGVSLKKDEPNSFAKKHPDLRNIAKTVALSATYGTTAFKMAGLLGKPTDEAQEIIDDYFDSFPGVKEFMLSSHEAAMEHGVAYSLFGRPRRIPKATTIKKIYGTTPHSDLPYEVRNILNLSVNHRVQSTGASIVNRAAIAFYKGAQETAERDTRWREVKMVLQVHDELVVECPTEIAVEVSDWLKYCMEKTVTLPGVDLIAEPKVAKNLADLK